MKKKRLFSSLSPSTWLRLSLIAVLLAACSPAQSTAPTNPPAETTQPPTASIPTATLAPTLESGTEIAPGEQATALPAATSRGPDLHATDPTTVSLASGGLQFIEFFRYT
jgi:hypothetical protein